MRVFNRKEILTAFPEELFDGLAEFTLRPEDLVFECVGDRLVLTVAYEDGVLQWKGMGFGIYWFEFESRFFGQAMSVMVIFAGLICVLAC